MLARLDGVLQRRRTVIVGPERGVQTFGDTLAPPRWCVERRDACRDGAAANARLREPRREGSPHDV